MALKSLRNWAARIPASFWWLFGEAALALLAPWLAASSASAEAGMITILLLLFAADPMYALLLGIYAGGDVRRRFWHPFLFAGMDLLGLWFSLDWGNPDFLFYVLFCLGVGLIGMAVRILALRWRRRASH